MTEKNPLVTEVYDGLLQGVVRLLEEARITSARSVNAIMTATYWEIGHRIVEREQEGRRRAGYGEALIERLAADLTAEFGRGFSRSNLWQMRDFYMAWPIMQAVPAQLESTRLPQRGEQTLQTLSGELGSSTTPENLQTVSGKSSPPDINASPRFPLPWSHYVRLLSVKDAQARTFYEAEAHEAAGPCASLTGRFRPCFTNALRCLEIRLHCCARGSANGRGTRSRLKKK